LPVQLVFGHMGYAPPGNCNSDGFRALLRLMRDGRAWTKLSGPYRLTDEAFPYPSLGETAHQLVVAAPSRLVWGTDWPHVNLYQDMPNHGGLLNQFIRWVNDPMKLEQILVHNPAKLYDFD